MTEHRTFTTFLKHQINPDQKESVSKRDISCVASKLLINSLFSDLKRTRLQQTEFVNKLDSYRVDPCLTSPF